MMMSSINSFLQTYSSWAEAFDGMSCVITPAVYLCSGGSGGGGGAGGNCVLSDSFFLDNI